MTSNNHHYASLPALIITSPQELEQLINASVQRALQGFHPAEHPPESGRYLTITEAASYLNLAKQTLYGYTSNRTIPFIKRAKRLLFLKSDLDSWLAEGKKHALIRIKSTISGGRVAPSMSHAKSACEPRPIP